MVYKRTEEHRRLRAELIRQWKPWEKSTGPRTLEGKANSSRNSTKHGFSSIDTKDEISSLRSVLT